ncbi:MAG: DEAD/DEAH box helicase [Pseudomonadota bacterium]
MASFIKDTAKGALWVDMGLGKTVSTLTALADIYDGFDLHRVLIVAPKRVAQSTWPAEIGKWAHVSHLSHRVISGTPAQRNAIIEHDTSTIHLIGVDLLPWLIKEICGEKISRLGRWPYDTIVLDESSGFKNRSAKRFKALRRVLPRVENLVELTGTPAPNGLLDIWAQLFLLDGGERLGKSFTHYRDRYFTSDYMGYTWEIKPGAEEQIYAAIADIVLVLKAEDYLRMPDRFDNYVEVALPPGTRKQYRDFEREFLLKLEDETIAAFSAAALTGKLLQFANGAIYTDDQGSWTEIHTAKIEALHDIVAGANGAPVLIAYSFKSDLARLKDAFPNGVDLSADPGVIEKWNRGEIPQLFAHPQSAGHGLNLQAGSHIAVWFGLPWSLELYQQFNARLHRQGQTKPVIIHHIVTQDTVDQTVVAALARKDTTQSALLHALKDDIAERIAA